MNRRWVGVLVFLLMLTLPGASALSFPWSGTQILETSVGAYPIHLSGVEQSGNIAVITWDVPPNCISGYGTVLISKDGRSVTERVSLGRLKPWGKKVAVFFNVREPIYVKLRITSGNGVFMSSWVKLEPAFKFPVLPKAYGTKRDTTNGEEIKPQFVPAIIGTIVIVGTTLKDAYDAYNACKNYGIGSMECKVQSTLLIVGVAIPGASDKGIRLVSKLGKKFGVSEKIYSVLKRARVIDRAKRVVKKFFGIFDDIVRHGDDAAKALDDLVSAGVSTEAIEEAVKHGATVKAVKEGIEKFAEKEIKTKFSVRVGSTTKSIEVVFEKGSERDGGLIHTWLRHVLGVSMEDMSNKPVTNFWPMGQEIIVNGQKKKLPKVFDSPKELREFIDEVLKRVSNDEDLIREQLINKWGAWKSNVPLKIDLKKYGINVDGIEEIVIELRLENGKYVAKTAYPTKGWAVWQYRSTTGEWIWLG
ncbi:hypothetical protein [Thermococcus eurythermalis]|uniref:hypothetical protein n=1 Tax=Thermococcus eurythermalis TaxID=1505907 RepID=UPI0006795934|nr:hypothetical protein [Thermococcus eurythermalis]